MLHINNIKELASTDYQDYIHFLVLSNLVNAHAKID